MLKARKQGSNNKGIFNSPIFSTFVGYYIIHVLNILVGLLKFSLLLDPYFLAFYTTICLQILYTTNFLIENVFSYLSNHTSYTDRIVD